jgi:hypothetical protein
MDKQEIKINISMVFTASSTIEQLYFHSLKKKKAFFLPTNKLQTICKFVKN